MSYRDEVEKALSGFAEATAKSDLESRQFLEAWERIRNYTILPILRETAGLVNEKSGSGLSAEAKSENGSVILQLKHAVKGHSERTGQIRFSPAHRKVHCWAYISGDDDDGIPEHFDADKLDNQAIETRVYSFLQKFLELLRS